MYSNTKYFNILNVNSKSAYLYSCDIKINHWNFPRICLSFTLRKILFFTYVIGFFLFIRMMSNVLINFDEIVRSLAIQSAKRYNESSIKVSVGL